MCSRCCRVRTWVWRRTRWTSLLSAFPRTAAFSAGTSSPHPSSGRPCGALTVGASCEIVLAHDSTAAPLLAMFWYHHRTWAMCLCWRCFIKLHLTDNSHVVNNDNQVPMTNFTKKYIYIHNLITPNTMISSLHMCFFLLMQVVVWHTRRRRRWQQPGRQSWTDAVLRTLGDVH